MKDKIKVILDRECAIRGDYCYCYLYKPPCDTCYQNNVVAQEIAELMK